MPWKECHVVDERLRFIARLLDGEKMAPVCADFGISRKTGYKIYDRYKDFGLRGSPIGVAAVSIRQSAPAADREAHRPLKREYPDWGAPKIRERLRQRIAGVRCPAISTVHAVLDRHGLVKRRRRRRYKADGHIPLLADASECAVVRGLQRRVHARQSPVLLSLDDHRLRESVSLGVRSAVLHAGSLCVPRVRAHVQRIWVARGHSHRQRRALFVAQCALWAESPLGLVAPPRHSIRTDSTGPSRAEWPT